MSKLRNRLHLDDDATIAATIATLLATLIVGGFITVITTGALVWVMVAMFGPYATGLAVIVAALFIAHVLELRHRDAIAHRGTGTDNTGRHVTTVDTADDWADELNNAAATGWGQETTPGWANLPD